jgi:hypothetical protein
MSTEQYKFQVFEHEQINPLAGHELTDVEEFLAATLLRATSERPMQIKDLRNALRGAGRHAVGTRNIKKVVRTLRKDHALPILSRRTEPAGYWWCSSPSEMEGFIKLFRSQALDELHTLSKMVRHNYPELAGQLSLEDALLKGAP